MREIRYIEWVDSSAGTGWHPNSSLEAEEPLKIATVGFVLKENGSHVVIVQSFDNQEGDSQHANNFLSVPKIAITKSKTLRKASAH